MLAVRTGRGRAAPRWERSDDRRANEGFLLAAGRDPDNRWIGASVVVGYKRRHGMRREIADGMRVRAVAHVKRMAILGRPIRLIVLHRRALLACLVCHCRHRSWDGFMRVGNSCFGREQKDGERQYKGRHAGKQGGAHAAHLNQLSANWKAASLRHRECWCSAAAARRAGKPEGRRVANVPGRPLPRPCNRRLDPILWYRVYASIVRTGVSLMPLTIGRVAAEAGVSIQTIRYYERRGLLAAPGRTASGYRLYSKDAVSRLRFIKHAQELGFSLSEAGELLDLRVQRGTACDTVERSARQKIELVQRKIRGLQRVKQTLESLAAACETRRATDVCPILEALEDHGNTNH